MAGITNIVFASSETVQGLPFDTPPPYVPVDEEYAPRPETPYSLGKLVDETIAAPVLPLGPGLKIVGLRFSNVMDVEDYAAFPGFDADATTRKWNLWSYIDARDGAQAVRKALEATFTGFEAFIIANADTVMSRPNAELLPRSSRASRSARCRPERDAVLDREGAESSATNPSTAGAPSDNRLGPVVRSALFTEDATVTDERDRNAT